MSKETVHLLQEIEAFLSATGMGVSYFGKASVGNSELVRRMRNGSRCWPETAEAIREFMAARLEKGRSNEPGNRIRKRA